MSLLRAVALSGTQIPQEEPHSGEDVGDPDDEEDENISILPELAQHPDGCASEQGAENRKSSQPTLPLNVRATPNAPAPIQHRVMIKSAYGPPVSQVQSQQRSNVPSPSHCKLERDPERSPTSQQNTTRTRNISPQMKDWSHSPDVSTMAERGWLFARNVDAARARAKLEFEREAARRTQSELDNECLRSAVSKLQESLVLLSTSREDYDGVPTSEGVQAYQADVELQSVDDWKLEFDESTQQVQLFYLINWGGDVATWEWADNPCKCQDAVDALNKRLVAQGRPHCMSVSEYFHMAVSKQEWLRMAEGVAERDELLQQIRDRERRMKVQPTKTKLELRRPSKTPTALPLPSSSSDESENDSVILISDTKIGTSSTRASPSPTRAASHPTPSSAQRRPKRAVCATTERKMARKEAQASITQPRQKKMQLNKRSAASDIDAPVSTTSSIPSTPLSHKTMEKRTPSSHAPSKRKSASSKLMSSTAAAAVASSDVLIFPEVQYRSFALPTHAIEGEDAELREVALFRYSTFFPHNECEPNTEQLKMLHDPTFMPGMCDMSGGSAAGGSGARRSSSRVMPMVKREPGLETETDRDGVFQTDDDSDFAADEYGAEDGRRTSKRRRTMRPVDGLEDSSSPQHSLMASSHSLSLFSIQNRLTILMHWLDGRLSLPQQLIETLLSRIMDAPNCIDCATSDIIYQFLMSLLPSHPHLLACSSQHAQLIDTITKWMLSTLKEVLEYPPISAEQAHATAATLDSARVNQLALDRDRRTMYESMFNKYSLVASVLLDVFKRDADTTFAYIHRMEEQARIGLIPETNVQLPSLKVVQEQQDTDRMDLEDIENNTLNPPGSWDVSTAPQKLLPKRRINALLKDSALTSCFRVSARSGGRTLAGFRENLILLRELLKGIITNFEHLPLQQRAEQAPIPLWMLGRVHSMVIEWLALIERLDRERI